MTANGLKKFNVSTEPQRVQKSWFYCSYWGENGENSKQGAHETTVDTANFLWTEMV
jgi:hypothetical protein